MNKAKALSNIAKANQQTTPAFEAWADNLEPWEDNSYKSVREQNAMPQTKGFNLKKHKEDYG